MPPEAALAAPEAPDGPHEPAAPTSAGKPAQRNAKQRKRDFRKDRRRRRRISERIAVDPTLTDCTKTVALAALRYSDDSAKPVYPSVGAIAQAASCQRRSARRCIVDLVEAGYVRRIQRPIASRRNATNLYYFCEPLGPPAPHREGQRRRPRARLGRIPHQPVHQPVHQPSNGTPEAQNPSSHRRTPETPEPAKQVPNPTPMEPSASAPSASSQKNTAKFSSRPQRPASAPFQPPGPTPEPDRSIAQAHLRAARDALRTLTNPHQLSPRHPKP